MAVKELIELLQKENQDAIVVMASDAEGNRYSPFRLLWTGNYAAETNWGGTAGYAELTDELREIGYTEEDIVEGIPAVVLFPIN
ncbi:MAG: hypothetical protein ACRC06_12310 [Waterburya sp.]